MTFANLILLHLANVIFSVEALSCDNSTLTAPGDSIVLTCTCSGTCGNTYAWTKGNNNTDLSMISSGKYSVNSTNNIYNLTVTNVGESDIGIYQCTNKVYVTDTATVSILSVPVVVNLQSPSYLTEGETLNISCTAWGWPTPLYAWYQGNNQLTASSTGVSLYNINANMVNAGLVIVKINQTDQNSYICSVINSVGSTNVTAYIRVKDRLAALWPFIGIVIIILITVIIILVVERNRKRENAKLHPQ